VGLNPARGVVAWLRFFCSCTILRSWWPCGSIPRHRAITNNHQQLSESHKTGVPGLP